MPEKLTIKWPNSTFPVTCYKTAVPGIVANRKNGAEDAFWVLTHERSGAKIPFIFFDTLKEALHCAKALKGICDWTKPSADLGLTERKNRDILCALGEAATEFQRKEKTG